MRFALLCTACFTLAQTLPTCLPTQTPPPPAGVRGAISTTASSPPTALPGVRVTLSASVGGDNAGDEVRFSWAQVGGPGVSLRNADKAAASFDAPSLPANSFLKFIVTTSNSAGDAGRAETQVEVAGDPNFFFGNGNSNDNSGTPGAALPVADAGESQTAQELETVFLDASGSTGDGLTYQWTQVGGQTVSIQNAASSLARFTVPSLGGQAQATMTFELAITDHFGRMSSATTEITIMPAEQSTDQDHPRVRLRTNLGNIILELDHTNAPITVDNFLQYVDDNFFDNTIFHRVIPGFVIQGGGFSPGLVSKEARDPIHNESDNGLKNDRGTISMARTSDLNSATSQFFINLADNTSLNASSGANGYAVFGRVIQGMTVVDQIASQPTESRNGLQDVPVRDVVLLSADRIAVE